MKAALIAAALAANLVFAFAAPASSQSINKDSTVSNLKLATTVIWVENGVREVLEFYSKAFGFPIRYYDDDMKFGELEMGAGANIMIQSYQAARFMISDQIRTSPTKRPEDAEIAFIASDVAAAYDRAVDAGAKPLRPPRIMPWGQTVAYVASIEGTVIALVTTPPVLSSMR